MPRAAIVLYHAGRNFRQLSLAEEGHQMQPKPRLVAGDPFRRAPALRDGLVFPMNFAAASTKVFPASRRYRLATCPVRSGTSPWRRPHGWCGSRRFVLLPDSPANEQRCTIPTKTDIVRRPDAKTIRKKRDQCALLGIYRL